MTPIQKRITEKEKQDWRHPVCKKCEFNDNCHLQKHDELWNCADVMNYDEAIGVKEE